MKANRWILVGSLVAVLLLALAAGLTWAQGPGQEGGASAQGDVSIAANVEGKVPIQGRLTDADGNPLNGDYEITASIYNVSSGGTALCSKTQTVNVSNGLFNMTIDNCTLSDIDGEQLYLGIKVGSDAEMTPRQPIYPVPYAWSLKPGARVIGEQVDWNAIYAANTATSGASYGVRAISLSPDGRGVSGENTAGGIGVYGYASGSGIAIKAGGSGIIQSTAVSRIFVPGIEAVPHADSRNDLDFLRYGRGIVIVLRPAGSGDEEVLIPIPVPAVLYGQPVRVADLRIHYATSNSNTYIDKTELFRERSDGGYYTLISSDTNRTSTAFTYYHLNCNATECRLGDEISYLTVALHLHFASGSHYVRIGGVRITLEHD